jgi:hypothetical protein
MRLFPKVDGAVDRYERAGLLTMPFDLALGESVEFGGTSALRAVASVTLALRGATSYALALDGTPTRSLALKGQSSTAPD